MNKDVLQQALEALRGLADEFVKVYPIYYYAEPWAHDRNEVLKNARATIGIVESALQQQPAPAALAIKTYTDGTSATGTTPLPAHSPAQQDARKDAWVEAVWAAMRDLSLTSDAVKPMNIHTVRLFCEEAWKRLPAIQQQESRSDRP